MPRDPQDDPLDGPLDGQEDLVRKAEFEGLLHRALKSQPPAPPPEGCPKETVWLEVAAGISPSDRSLVCLEHASRCSTCATLLREAMAEFVDLSREPAQAESNYIAALASAQGEWQKGMSERLAKSAHRESTPWWQSRLLWRRERRGQRQSQAPFQRLALAGACFACFALLLAGVASWMLWRSGQPATAERLLARAYTQKRTLELRFADAKYAPLRISRGAEGSFASRPPALLQAESMIAGEMASQPANLDWLRAEAEADLLEGKYDAAVHALRHALEVQPNSPPLLIDLATAYYQRSQQSGRQDDAGQAYECLSKALTAQPDDPVALFNRALVSESDSLFLYRQALEDWDHYLRIDPSSEWSREAHEHADALREKLKTHSKKMGPLLSYREIASRSSAGRQSASADKREVGENADAVNARVEEYLDEAIRDWLPKAFPSGGQPADPAARAALFF